MHEFNRFGGAACALGLYVLRLAICLAMFSYANVSSLPVVSNYNIWSVRGDTFFPVILTNHGGWQYHSNDFMVEVTHSGDKADLYNIKAERFDHYSRTRASWSGQHSTFLIQDPSCFLLNGTSNLCYGCSIQNRCCYRIRRQICFSSTWASGRHTAAVT